MTEPAGVEPAHQVLTARQRDFLANGMVPEPTEQQAREMSVFAELHGPASGADFAWTYAARLLMDHFDASRYCQELARMARLVDAAQLARDQAQFAAADARALLDFCAATREDLFGAGIVYRCSRERGHGGRLHEGSSSQDPGGFLTWPVEESRPWWRRVVDRLRADPP